MASFKQRIVFNWCVSLRKVNNKKINKKHKRKQILNSSIIERRTWKKSRILFKHTIKSNLFKHYVIIMHSFSGAHFYRIRKLSFSEEKKFQKECALLNLSQLKTQQKLHTNIINYAVFEVTFFQKMKTRFILLN